MSYKIVIQPEAEIEIFAAVDWYQYQLRGLGNRFLNDLKDLFERIQIAPEHYSFYAKNYRKALLKDFPLNVIFEIDGNTIVVHNIYHTSRRPKNF